MVVPVLTCIRLAMARTACRYGDFYLVVPIAAWAARSPSRSFLYSLVFAWQRRERPAVMDFFDLELRPLQQSESNWTSAS